MISYNSSRFLPEFFRTLLRYTDYPFHLIVIDNKSSDRSRAYLSRIRKHKLLNKRLELVFNPKDLGVAKAWNQGIRLCHGEYIVFLNTDIKFTKGWLSRLVKCAKRHPKAGVIGAKILNFDGTLQYAKGVRCRGEKDDSDKYQKEMEVDQIHGCCFLVKRSIFPKVGLFDERFFMYAEEIDFCIRAWKTGFSVIYTPVPIYHYGGGSVDPKERKLLFSRSKKLFKEKWKIKKRGKEKKGAKK